VSATRPWVDAFADTMEAKLAENRHKGNREGWSLDSHAALLARLREEVGELERALANLERATPGTPTHDEAKRWVRREAADVGNFSMMISDVAGGLRPRRPPSARSGTGQ